MNTHRSNALNKLRNIVLLLVCFFVGHVNAAWHQQTQNMMGTEVSVELWAESHDVAERALAAVFAEMQRIDKTMNPWDEHSQLASINRSAGTGPVEISEEFYQLISKALYYSRLSEGAFDISFASVAQFYNYSEEKKPTHKQRLAVKNAINYQNIKLDKKYSTLHFLDSRIQIDLGGIAKGYAVDRSINLLKTFNVRSAIVSAGGDSRVLGDKNGRPWVMGIQHPRDKQQHAVRIPLANTAISTSGDYERYFMEGDYRHHHIINPATAKSAAELQSVSVLADKAVDSDALSTTVFVLGVKKGLALINRLPGIDAIIIDQQGLLHYSADLLMPQ